MEIVRDVAGDLVEGVQLVCLPFLGLALSLSRTDLSLSQIDSFTHPKTGRESKCYRFNYRSMDRSLTNEEANELQKAIEERMVGELGVELR
jgi:phenylalanyl-tRNA synthetase alpha chain